jgi:glycosyltransferase involved in cell wall biosynthesis
LERSRARGRVVLTGYVSDEELRALYSSCRAFLYLSLYEGFGLPPLEAMSCGAPVVAGRTSAIAEVTDGAARLVSPDSSEEAAAALLELLEVEGARRALVEAGLRRASDFSWQRAARETLEVYAEALRRTDN